MNAIARYISKMVLLRFIGIALGVSIFVLTLEVVAYSKEILSLDRSAAFAVGNYMLHRAPTVFSTYIPISVLLAMLLALTEMTYRNEIVAIWAGGISPVRILIYLLPVALLCGVVQFLLLDRAIPVAAPQLSSWAIGDYGVDKLKVGERDPIWLRSGNDIVRAAFANPTSTLLEDVVIFRREPTGVLLEQIFAETAKQQGGEWLLSKVTVFPQDKSAATKLETLKYSGAVRLAAAGSRSGEPLEMTTNDLLHFIGNDGFGIRPAHVYATWLHKRIASLLTALLMMALCIPLAAKFRRGGGLGFMFIGAVAMGFGYFLLDGITLSAGELGYLPAWLAGWLPTLVFGTTAGYLMLRTETV